MKKVSKIIAAVIVTLSVVFAGCHKPEENEASLPVVETSAVDNITNTTAICGGVVTSDGGSSITERGVCWSKESNPIATGSHLVAEGDLGAFSCHLTGLEPNTTYYVKAYAVNSDGVAYGAEISFVTLQEDVPPVVSVMEATEITDYTAMCRASIDDEGTSAVVAKGFCWSITHSPTIDDTRLILSASDPFEGTITRLEPNTVYYLRAYAINSSGVGYSTEISFTTMPSVPPTVVALEEDGYLVDGQVIDIDKTYEFGFVMSSSVGLASLAVWIDDYVCDYYDLYGLSDFYYVSSISYSLEKEIIGESTIKAVVTDVKGETNSASIRVAINSVPLPLEPMPFEWNRHGSSGGTGLEEFGLKWTHNIKDNYARIEPLDGVSLFQFDPDVWNEVNTTEDKSNLFETATGISLYEYANVSVWASADYDDVIGTILPDGTMYLIHVTNCYVFVYKMMDITISGEWK